MIWRPFYVKCVSCGHRNKPAGTNGTVREQVWKAMTEPQTCKGCKEAFWMVVIPRRPIVEEFIKTIEEEFGKRIKNRYLLPTGEAVWLIKPGQRVKYYGRGYPPCERVFLKSGRSIGQENLKEVIKNGGSS